METKFVTPNQRSYLLTKTIERAPNLDTDTFWENSKTLTEKEYRTLLAYYYNHNYDYFEDGIRKLILR